MDGVQTHDPKMLIKKPRQMAWTLSSRISGWNVRHLRSLIVTSIAIAACLIGSPPVTAQKGEVFLEPIADDMPEGYMIIEGDIVVPSSFFDAADRENAAYSSNLWPDGVIPCECDTGVASQNQYTMLSAMAEWEAVALAATMAP